ncbi:MAG: hypothetical protein KGL95_09170 [Patescibacteria group bacterium]|nr:hypothetical protein [Patescibacteria group bacterium]
MRHIAGIVAFVGLRGSGKTLHMVYYAKKAMIAGRACYSNTPIKFKHHGRYYEAKYIRSAKDFEQLIVTARNAVIAIDEAGSLLPARYWKSIGWDVVMKFRESRKDSCDLYYTAQAFRQVTKDLRELTEMVGYCVPQKFMHTFSHTYKIYWKGVRTFFYRKYYKRIPKLLINMWKTKFTSNYNYHATAWNNYWKFMDILMFKRVTLMNYKAYFSGTSNYSGSATIFGKLWYQRLWGTDLLRPRQYIDVFKAYDTKAKTTSRFGNTSLTAKRLEVSAQEYKPAVN